MASKNTLQSNYFNFDNVAERLRKADLQRKRQLQAEIYAKSRRPAPRPRAVAAPRRSPWSALSAALRDESKQLVVASFFLIGIAGWLCSAVQVMYEHHVQAVLAAACHQNQLNHAADAYCFDDRRFIHTLNPDGTATKSGPDWRVNEAALRMAEAASAHQSLVARQNNQ